ncbi:MAG TPA: trypsin-like peptidase domain-containing protein [Gaiellaceae bacterium]|nr:trypsin-like peptidase domain-containing protein [Gaiellaceae bacterium]
MNLRPAGPRLRRLLPLAVAVAIGAAAGAGAYALSSHGSGTPRVSTVVVPAQSASSTSNVDSLTQLYKQDAPAVVEISVESTTSSGSSGGFPFGPGGSQTQEAEGSGFVIDTKGDILTAEHVVAGANSIKVQFEDGSTAKATLVGSDKTTDTAVIHVDATPSQVHPLTLGSSASVQPGEAVVAIGSPFRLPETMTAGIVSATGRTITAPNGFSITDAIQTDAAINHGNSGGPLIDVATNTVIGINDQILNAGDTQDNAGVGFAAPIDASKTVAHTLIAGGKVQHAYLGVLIISGHGGARVAKIVSGGPAQKAGLKSGDVITAFAGHRVTSASELTTLVSAAQPGQTVNVTVQRGGATKHFALKLGVQPAAAIP